MGKSSLVETLGAEHQEALNWLNRLDDALDSVEKRQSLSSETRSVVEGFSAFLKEALLTHFRLEEVALFPVLGRVVGTESGPIAVMLAEHKDVERDQREIEAELTSQAPNIANLLFAGRDVIAVLSQHIHKEDNVLFPMAYRFLDNEQLAEVDRRAQEDVASQPASGKR